MYSQEVAEAIIDRLSRESLLRICKDADMPNRRTVERWMDADAEFAAKCARARESHADHIFDGMEEIEDGVLSGEIKPDAAKVVISSRQWRAEKLKPRVYGVKADVNLTGTIQFQRIETVIVDAAG